MKSHGKCENWSQAHSRVYNFMFSSLFVFFIFVESRGTLFIILCQIVVWLVYYFLRKTWISLSFTKNMMNLGVLICLSKINIILHIIYIIYFFRGYMHASNCKPIYSKTIDIMFAKDKKYWRKFIYKSILIKSAKMIIKRPYDIYHNNHISVTPHDNIETSFHNLLK